MMNLNVHFNADDATMLRKHLRACHRSLMNPVCDGPLPEDLEAVPDEVLFAIHQANHMAPWSSHSIDYMKGLPDA